MPPDAPPGLPSYSTPSTDADAPPLPAPCWVGPSPWQFQSLASSRRTRATTAKYAHFHARGAESVPRPPARHSAAARSATGSTDNRDARGRSCRPGGQPAEVNTARDTTDKHSQEHHEPDRYMKVDNLGDESHRYFVRRQCNKNGSSSKHSCCNNKERIKQSPGHDLLLSSLLFIGLILS